MWGRAAGVWEQSLSQLLGWPTGGPSRGRHGDLLWDVAAVSRGWGQDPSWGFKGNLKTVVNW